MAAIEIRDATEADVAACAAIYGAYVVETPATFEIDPPSVEEMGRRIAACQAGHSWLVAERDGVVTGFAYGTRWAERPAYRWACEVSVYLARDSVGGGVGSALYAALLDRLTERGFHVAFAKVAQPNDASNALHARFGFRRVGLLERVGHKLGAWHDVAILQRDLVPVGITPEEPR
ncbi:GNAT family N-acetyltransferase [Nocardioides antri]|uniref:N-acetyltransferase family protein n=1 Tax=Nocardioides antri TaxID=2607659 RepID=A0A5B1M456_9ACTN|nr:GNAT family N-acetyltransferase [Nocardioides antri]KAA1426530.1 N-acetyltransferase family protein [Nocardioides antri]